MKVTRPGRDKSLHWAHVALRGRFSVKWMSSQAEEEVGGWVTVLPVQEKAPRTAPAAPLPAVTGVGQLAGGRKQVFHDGISWAQRAFCSRETVAVQTSATNSGGCSVVSTWTLNRRLPAS